MAKKFRKNERGATLVEYSLLVALVAIVALGAVKAIGTQISGSFSKVNTELSSATASSVPTP